MSIPAFDPVAGIDWRETHRQYSFAQHVDDVDGDGKLEILLGGTSHPETKIGGRKEWGGELRIVTYEKSKKLVLKHREVWTGAGTACVWDVFAADVDKDGKKEIIAVGDTAYCYADKYGNRLQSNRKAHLRVGNWDGKNFIFKNELVWTPSYYSDTSVKSVWAGDIDGDGSIEIVCGGSAWVGHEEVAWFDIFDGNLLTLKGRKVWMLVKKENSALNALSAADVDGDGKKEVVTVGLRWVGNRYHGRRTSKGELIAWDIVSLDKGLDIKKKASVLWDPKNGDFVEPRSLWIGDIWGEKGNEVVTGGIQSAGPFDDEDYIGTDIRIWRLSGNSFNLKNHFPMIFTTSSGHYWKSTCNSVCAADIEKDGQKELLAVSEAALKGSRNIAYLLALNPSKSLLTSPMDEVFKRTRSYEIWAKGKKADTVTTGVDAADIDGDGKIETIVSGHYMGFEIAGVFVFIWR